MKISCVILLFAVITTTVVCSDAQFRGLRIIDANGNTQTNSGRLELQVVSSNGVDFQWGSICDDGFNDNSANTACNSLGYEGAISWSGRGLIPGTGPILLDEVSCPYVRDNIIDCPHNPLGVHDCQHSEDVSITCRLSELRLVNQNGAVAQNEGWVEVFYDHRWGSFCVNRDSDSWTSNAAAVVCRQLGIPGASSGLVNTGYSGISVTTYADLACLTGTETSVEFCGRLVAPRSTVYNTCNRGNFGYLYVRCGNPTPPPSASRPPVLPSPSAAPSQAAASRPPVLPSASPTNGIPALRLTNFANLVNEGYVEVWKNGRWGSVCADGRANWAQNAASVVCRQLGLAGVRTAVVDTGYSQVPLPNYGTLSCSYGNEPNVLAPSCNRADEVQYTTCNEDHFGYLYVTCLKSFLSQKEEVEAESILNGNYSSQNVIMGSSLVGVAILVTAFIVRKRRAATAANVVNKAIPLAENDQMKETI